MPFCFLNLLDVTATFLFGILGFKVTRIAPEKEIREMPEETDFPGVGGHRVGPTEHEVMAREGG